jgi:hypothetical protein
MTPFMPSLLKTASSDMGRDTGGGPERPRTEKTSSARPPSPSRSEDDDEVAGRVCPRRASLDGRSRSFDARRDDAPLYTKEHTMKSLVLALGVAAASFGFTGTASAQYGGHHHGGGYYGGHHGGYGGYYHGGYYRGGYYGGYGRAYYPYRSYGVYPVYGPTVPYPYTYPYGYGYPPGFLNLGVAGPRGSFGLTVVP